MNEVGKTTKKGIMVVFSANIMVVILNGIISFLLPKYLSIESYGHIKTFQLWLSYVGLLALGYMDATYLKYGGRVISDIDRKELSICHGLIRGYHLLLTIAFVFCGIYFKNALAICLGLILYPYNMSNYYRSFFQAVGEFKKYGKVLAMIPALTCLLDCTALFVYKTDNYTVYVEILVIVSVITYIYLEIVNSKYIERGNYVLFRVNEYFSSAKSGITLMLGNFTSTLLTSIDRWFVVALLSISEFSFYSFAATIEAMFNTCTSPVTITLYNYFCKNDNSEDQKKIQRVNDMCVIAAIMLISIAFPCKYVIENYLTRYKGSIILIFLLLAAHVFFFVIKAVYVNIQKARGDQNTYFKQIVIVLALSVVSNLVAYLYTQSNIGFAIATLVTAFIWFLMCLIKYKGLFISFRSVIAQVISVILFIFIGMQTEATVGFVVYVLIAILISIVLLKDSFYALVTLIFPSNKIKPFSK